jgi:prepilin-type N-terminal cleavage/methylation domain-containing protein
MIIAEHNATSPLNMRQRWQNFKNRAENGYSLTELLVVVFLIGLIAAIAYPALTRTMQEYRLNRSMREVMANIQIARMKSVSNNIEYKFEFDTSTDPNEYQVSGAESFGPDGAFHTWNDVNGNGLQDTDLLYKTPQRLLGDKDVSGEFGTSGISLLPDGSAVGSPPSLITITFQPDGTISTASSATNYPCVVLQLPQNISMTQGVCVETSGLIRIYKLISGSWTEIK